MFKADCTQYWKCLNCFTYCLSVHEQNSSQSHRFEVLRVISNCESHVCVERKLESGLNTEHFHVFNSRVQQSCQSISERDEPTWRRGVGVLKYLYNQWLKTSSNLSSFAKFILWERRFSLSLWLLENRWLPQNYNHCYRVSSYLI